jgi:hypothetical protein
MHRVVIDEPYEFVPPYPGRCWLGAQAKDDAVALGSRGE